ncbi:type II toxin-antitoxin system RelE/ParE family toxin [Aminobacter sp. BE322]|uniref:type II toxin-antitoxin system RelE/ParE family toxin n=1 Tax=unclassified Aminobacter TaxID=2644704 RepID=UPI003D25405F
MRIRRTAKAEADLLAIWCYIAADNEAAADRLLDRFELRWNALAHHPSLGRTCSDIAEGVRCLGEGEYLIFCRVAEESVDILRVLHGRRNITGDDLSS